jgi:C-terminal processing protease CtpA/Prc
MRLTLVSLFLLTAHLVAQPSQSDRYRYAPLLSTAKLWNMIRYLDPRAAGDSTAWDAALVAALPKIEAAHSDEDLAKALDAMLETLHDPCTRISLGLPGNPVSVQSIDSGTMVIHAGNGDLTSSMGAGLMLKMGIAQTDNIVWDLRGSRIPFGRRPGTNDLRRNGLGYAFRQFSGYPAADGPGARYYSSSLQIVEPLPPIPRQGMASRRQIYLIDKNSAVPTQAIIDQVNSHSAILSEDSPQDLQAGLTELVQVLGRVDAEVRVAELYYPDGTTGFAPNRVVLNRGAEAVKAAAAAINTADWPAPGERPDFEILPTAFRDMAYPEYPNREMRILAAFRIWGILHYFNPRVSALANQWDDVLIELLPKFSEAKSERDYHLAIAEMLARTGDPSCRAESAELNDVFGNAAPSFEVRVLDNQLVVTSVFLPGSAEAGDVILKIDGAPVQDWVAKVAPYLPAPFLISRFLLTGAPRQVNLTVRRKDNTDRDIKVSLYANKKIAREHRGGEAVRLINEKIGYADLERLEPSGVDAMFEKFAQTAAVIFDLRGFPRDNALAIASRLGNRNQPVAAVFLRNEVGLGLSSDHITHLQSEFRVPATTKPRYTGKTVALIDELSSELSGESAMCFKAANDTVLIGSPVFPAFSVFTTVFDVPGGAKVYFGGETARWPDGAALQNATIKPDIEAVPTLAGLRAGQDELLDRAVAYLSK